MNHATFLKLSKARALKFIDLYRSGKTTTEISKKYGVSRQRVQQVLAKHGVGKHDGGAFVRTEKRLEKIKLKRDRRYKKMYGCTYDEWKYIQKRYKKYRRSPAYSYRNHKNLSRIRGIEFNLTLPEWWKIWCESGKFERRGKRNDQYVMSRHNDIGPYSTENVRIITVKENRNEYWMSPRAKDHGKLCQLGRNKEKANGTDHRD